ncbi:MAG: methionyl-tRNA formyltransferase [Acidobacteria bacterium]|nr:methionyl-tRNA formyltransferase [Acidobacteriota bacterium]
MRVIFMGTPAFAVSTLAKLVETGHEVLLVVTQPDRPVGRGRKLTPPPVKQKAVELGLDVFQPEKIKMDEAFERLESLAPDVIVVVGYGQIIPQRIIDLPANGCVNVHSSLLPKYRGAAPVNWAIVRGETVTGVCTMQIVKKLDAGDVLLCRETPIGENETASEVMERLAPMGAELLIETLAGLQAGTIQPKPQEDEASTYAPMMKREDGLIDWTLPAREIHNRARGFDPWPGAYTLFRGKRLHLGRTEIAEGEAPAGAIVEAGQALVVGCGGGGLLRVGEVQVEGKSRMRAADFANGYKPAPGERLGS